MLLTITTTHQPATDLGYLLHKNPARAQSFELPFGKAHVFYPEATPERCTAALLLEVDPVGLVRGHGPAGEGRALAQYVNDRPYVASSFLSVALAQVYGSALGGHSRERPELVDRPLPLVAQLPVLPCRGPEIVRRLFEPLGYRVSAQPYVLDERWPAWGASPYFAVTLETTARLQTFLAHLYVLVPVLDDDKHYWIGAAEVEKLLHHGGDWLSGHPERELISRRYLKHQAHLTRAALARLAEENEADPDRQAAEREAEEEKLERPLRLHDVRLQVVLDALRASGAQRVLDLGCGGGRLLQMLLADAQFTRVVGLDVSYRALELARDRLQLERRPPEYVRRLELLQGALTYRDERLAGFDAAAVVEVIEHLDRPRLAAFERVLFEFARPGTVVLTTPNVEYNALFPGLVPGQLRHRDHRFELTRAEFEGWATETAARFGYRARFAPIGPEDAQRGAPSQMAVFTLAGQEH